MFFFGKFNFLLCNQPNVKSEMKHQFKDLGCVNVLPGQGYFTPQGVVVAEYEAIMEYG
jgi:hypothetical protein